MFGLLRSSGALRVRLASPAQIALRASLPRATSAVARSLCSRPGPAAPEGGETKPLNYAHEGLLFEGGKNLMVKRLKFASLLNLGFALSASPVLQYITSLSGSGGKGVAMSAVLVLFGGSTTAGLTWISGTYVLAMKALPGGKAIVIETPTLFGGIATTEALWTDIVRPTSYHPFSTFQAKGYIFYMDEDGTLHDKQIIAKVEEALNRDQNDA